MNEGTERGPDLVARHYPYIVRLARDLVADEHDAQDLASKVCLRLLERPPSDPTSMRAWLATVARRLFIDSLSGDERRRHRERRVSREEAQGEEMLGVADVEEILAIPLLGVIPESEAVLKASNQGLPVIMDEAAKAGQAYSDAVNRLLGDEVAHRFLDVEKKGFFRRVMGGR